MNNILDSMIFLGILRNSICHEIDDNSVHSFIKNEATDYEIMSIIINGNLPEERFNIQKENQLWKEYKKHILTDRNIYLNIETEILKDFVKNINPIYEHGLTSQQDSINGLIKEEGTDGKDVVNAMAGVATASWSTVSKFATANAAPLAIAGAVALAVWAGYKIYKNYMTQAAKACSGRADKAECMRQFKEKAIVAKINKLQAGKSQCKNTKDPKKCIKKLDIKIEKEHLRLEKTKLKRVHN